MVQVGLHIRNYNRSIGVLLAGNHSHLMHALRMHRLVGAHQAGLRSRICAAEVVRHLGAKLGANGIREADASWLLSLTGPLGRLQDLHRRCPAPRRR
jgi:hypothetical protein